MSGVFFLLRITDPSLFTGNVIGLAGEHVEHSVPTGLKMVYFQHL